jgi:hypothetical protein
VEEDAGEPFGASARAYPCPLLRPNGSGELPSADVLQQFEPEPEAGVKRRSLRRQRVVLAADTIAALDIHLLDSGRSPAGPG